MLKIEQTSKKFYSDPISNKIKVQKYRSLNHLETNCYKHETHFKSSKLNKKQ